MAEWEFAQSEPSEQFAQVQYFSMVKKQGDRDIEFTISVKEFIKPTEPTMRFFAVANRQTNQKTLPYTPCGWGNSLLKALSECMNAIRRFPYEGE